MTDHDLGCNPAAHVHTSTCWWDLFEAAWHCPATRRFADRPIREIATLADVAPVAGRASEPAVVPVR